MSIESERKTGSQRQLEYVARLKERGYVRLTAVFIPKVLLGEVRALIKKRVAKWEKEMASSL